MGDRTTARRDASPGPVLVLRALGLGDFLTGVPALRALARAYPGRELVLAQPPVLDPLVRLSGIPARVLPSRGLAPIDWPAPPPAVAVNLHGRGPQSHRLLQDLRPGRLLAFACTAAGVDGPAWRADEHEVHRWCRLVSESLGVHADPADLRLLLERPREDLVVVHPGAASPARQWPAERYAAVARHGADRGRRVVVTGGVDDVDLAGNVARLGDLDPRAVLAGRTGPAELAEVIASASLVVCGDTGVAHLATALGTPSVLLFGPVSPATWGPPPNGLHTVLWHGDGTGDPHATAPDPALLAIDVEEVLAAVDGRLAPRPGAH